MIIVTIGNVNIPYSFTMRDMLEITKITNEDLDLQ